MILYLNKCRKGVIIEEEVLSPEVLYKREYPKALMSSGEQISIILGQENEASKTAKQKKDEEEDEECNDDLS